MKLAEAHAAELGKLCEDLDLETRSYTKYHQTVRHRLRQLHEIVVSSFGVVKAQCLPFCGKGVEVEEMLNWVAKEVKAALDMVWLLNDNFIILGIEGVLNMLNGKGCQELTQLRDLATSRDITILEDLPDDVHRLVGQIVRKWWKQQGLPEDLCRLEVARAATVSDCGN
jgi:hypothetical protein